MNNGVFRRQTRFPTGLKKQLFILKTNTSSCIRVLILSRLQKHSGTIFPASPEEAAAQFHNRQSAFPAETKKEPISEKHWSWCKPSGSKRGSAKMKFSVSMLPRLLLVAMCSGSKQLPGDTSEFRPVNSAGDKPQPWLFCPMPPP